MGVSSYETIIARENESSADDTSVVSKEPEIISKLERVREVLSKIDIESYLDLRPPNIPGVPPRDRTHARSPPRIARHPDSMNKMENVVLLDETILVSQAISILKRYGISSAPVINSYQCIFIGIQDIREYLVLFIEHALVKSSRDEVITQIKRLLNDTTVRQARTLSHPDEDGRFVYRGSKSETILSIVRGGFLKRIDVPSHGEETSIIPDIKRYQRTHRVVCYSLHFDKDSGDEAMIIDALISQTDVVELLLDYFSDDPTVAQTLGIEKTKNEDDPFTKISICEAFSPSTIDSRTSKLIKLPPNTRIVDAFATMTRENVNVVAVVNENNMLIDSVAAFDFAYFLEDFEGNLNLSIVDFTKRMRSKKNVNNAHVQQATMSKNLTADETTDEDKRKNVSPNGPFAKEGKETEDDELLSGKPNLRVTFLQSLLRDAMELMRPNNISGHRKQDRFSDVHHVFVINENGEPLFELTPGDILELVALPTAHKVFWRCEPCELHSVYRANNNNTKDTHNW